MSEKTEEPSAKKLRDARKKGEVARSKDFTQTLLILSLFGYLVANADRIIRSFGEMVLVPSTLTGLNFLDAANTAWTKLSQEATAILMPVILIVIGVGIFGEMMQVGVLLAFEALKPSGKKLDVVSNLKNIFSKKSLIDFIKSLVKIGILSTIVFILLRDNLGNMMSIPRAGLPGVANAIGAMMRSMLIYLSVAYTTLALADFGWQRYSHRKGLMMSKDEVKQEYKESEGDPHIKQHRRHLHQEMLSEEVSVERAKTATAVITNPTHIAVTIYYEKDETPLPVVSAMGEGNLAQRMIDAAKEAGVPVTQNIPLARSLFYSATVSHYIPSDLIEPVAEVLKLVQQLKGEEGMQ